MTAITIAPAKRRLRRPPLRVQLTVLYAGLFAVLVVAVLAVSGLLVRQGSTNINGGTSSHNAFIGQHLDAGPLVVALIAGVVALGLAWWIAGRFLRPLRAMNAAAREISATNLHRRLGIDGPADELTELGQTLDDLFGRLEASFEAQRHFVANASHELRTPLAGLQTLLEVAIADPNPDTESLRTVCQKALVLGQHQERLVSALLTLATSERGVEAWEQLDLAEITEAVLTARRHDAENQTFESKPTSSPLPPPATPSSSSYSWPTSSKTRCTTTPPVEPSRSPPSPPPDAPQSPSATQALPFRPANLTGSSDLSNKPATSAPATPTDTGSVSPSSERSPKRTTPRSPPTPGPKAAWTSP